MKIAQLNKLLKAGEWNDVEFKEARTVVPKSVFKTFAAFADDVAKANLAGILNQNGIQNVRSL